MSEPFLGEIRMFGFNYAPQNWAFCNGQVLNIHQNQALFAILGTRYGGNGTTTFALPDLRGRTPVHVSSDIRIAQSGGAETHTLTTAEMPMHTHTLSGSTGALNQRTPGGNVWGTSDNAYSKANPNDAMHPSAMSTAGSSTAHPNMQPYVTLNFCIAIVGHFPTRN